jgi:hypothetical protein
VSTYGTYPSNIKVQKSYMDKGEALGGGNLQSQRTNESVSCMRPTQDLCNDQSPGVREPIVESRSSK